MTSTVYFAGSDELVVLTNTFDINDVPADPASVTLTVTDPTGAQTTPAATRITTGKYTATIASAVPGIWTYQWDGHGDPSLGQASDIDAGTWTVSSPALNQYYCSAEELKNRLRLTTTSDDSEIMLAVAAASRAVDGYCERFFWRRSETRTYVPGGLYETKVDDLVSVTTLATDPAGTTPQGGTFPITWQASDFQLLPYNPGKLGEQWPYTLIRAVGHFTFPWVIPLLLMRQDRVQVTGVFGWPQVPDAVHTATLIAAAELFRMKDTPMGAGIPGEFAVATVSSNPMIGKLLAPYARNPVLAA